MSSHILYGSYASYYTAKVRAYLRKKGIGFTERLPSDPQFRAQVRPASGSHRIPQLLADNGDVIQDSVAIVDYLEARHPDIPAFPATPRQRVFTHLMELLGSEGLVQLAWLHRWSFADNLHFVKMDFGRSFVPQGTDAELMKYGNLIADRMMGNGGLPEATPAFLADLDSQYLGLLERLEAHFIHHPYLLGGHPSAGDYAMMGALHAHMGRDPVGLAFMQQHAPRVFRWVEHMLVPEIQSPEFFDRPVAYEADDAVPPTALAVLDYIAAGFGERFILGSLAFNQWLADTRPDKGTVVDAEVDQPSLPPVTVTWQGGSHTVRAPVHALWLGQRAQDYFASLPASDQAAVRTLLGTGNAMTLLETRLAQPLARRDNRLYLD